MITVVNIQANVDTQFRVPERLSPVGVVVPGCPGTQILPQNRQAPSGAFWRLCVAETAARGCGGLGVNLGAYPNLGLKFCAHVSRGALHLFLQSWNPEIGQDRAHLFPLCRRTVCRPWQKKNPLHVQPSCLLPIDSQNYDGQMGEVIRPIRYKFNHSQLGHCRLYPNIQVGLKNKWVSGRIQTRKS